MRGGEALLRSLASSGIEVCFANPGTSEMHVVSALDDVPSLRPVLVLFENVATGAADCYARMAERPAATLLHLGPGLANALSNLHNARRAQSPLVNVVGDHATYHQRFDSRLQSDLAGIAHTMSAWVRSTTRAADAPRDAADAVAAAWGPPGAIATLIVPADVSWEEGASPAPPLARPPAPVAASDRVEDIARRLREAGRATMLLGGGALCERGLRAADAIAGATGAQLIADTFPPRLARGGGLPDIEKLAYYAEMATAQLDGTTLLVLAGARRPVSFFAYPDKPSDLVPARTAVEDLAPAGVDVVAALEGIATSLVAPPRHSDGAGTQHRPERPSGALTAESAAIAVGHTLPEGAIVVDESITSGLFMPAATAGAPRHDWLSLAGGSLGQGLPGALGASIACPDRRVLCLEADGSAMYTIQALWTHAREGADVTTVVLANRAYAILQLELDRVGAAGAGDRAAQLLELDRPPIDFVTLANGLGVPAARATSAEELTSLLERSYAEDGPMLIEATLA